jgi:hypothetical protein
MRYLLFLLFLGSSLLGMEADFPLSQEAIREKRMNSTISKAEYEAAKPWRDFFNLRLDKRIEKLPSLLQAGVDPRMRIPTRSFSGCLAETPLHRAAASDSKDLVNYLLAYGADPNGENGQGQHALFNAFAQYGQHDFTRKETGRPVEVDMSIAKLLLLQGANPHKRDRFKKSVIDCVDERDVELKDMLENFASYRSEHAAEFDEMQHELDILRIEREFKRTVKRNGLWNALHGINMRRLPICPPLPAEQNVPFEAGKRKRDDDENGENFRSPKSRAFALN